MLNRYINLAFIYHLNNYDLANKFSYNTYYSLPFITKLSLKIFLKGILNSDFLRLYLKNFLLLYLFCFNILNCCIKFKKIRRRKLKSYKLKLFLSYTIMKKSLLRVIFDFFFLFKKFVRPFYFSNHSLNFSKKGGKLYFFNSKIITFLPSLMLLDHKEQRIFPTLKKSKIFLTIILKIFFKEKFYNFFQKYSLPNKNFLKNFLGIWYFI